ncbi:hypothetical protein PIROE2DRAFT_69998 [Piromyces sp. E2]|nr:hypothetical protein PIROE2DRAFT_69998 [Piromyces sp. E2]|eukprot:OUM58077.1 hypothetical protein PIROE2DRAFT_69998 [Piromyces sp. E2]
MKTLNLIFVVALCFMAISRVSGTYYIIKTFENYSSKEDASKEGQLNADGQKRVECFAGLVGSKITKPDHIYYKADGVSKDGTVKVNSRKFTAEAIAQKLGGIPANAITKDEQLSNLMERTHADGSTNSVFVWSDKDKAKEVATALGAAPDKIPAEFKKDNYGGIWAIEGSDLKEMTMGCDGLPDSHDGSSASASGSQSSIRLTIMYLAVAVMTALYFF